LPSPPWVKANENVAEGPRFGAALFLFVTAFRRLYGAKKYDKVLFLLRRQLCAEDQVEELDRVVQRQQALVM
jgi:hypothetical protein